jgi:hypothetical protein
MKISTILYHLDHGRLALPCFARDYVWSPSQVLSFLNSLYRGHPAGSLILWTPAIGATAKQAEFIPDELLVDGRQRVTSIYNVARARPPHFSKDAKSALPRLFFHIGDQTFDFFKPCMQDDTCWIDLEAFFNSPTPIGGFIEALHKTPARFERLTEYLPRLHQLNGILDRNLHVEYLPTEASLEEAVEVFHLANGGGLGK